MAHPEARLTEKFIARVADTGLTPAATAAAIGVTPQEYARVLAGKCAPSVRFMWAVRSGLAETFADVAEPTTPITAAEAA